MSALYQISIKLCIAHGNGWKSILQENFVPKLLLRYFVKKKKKIPWFLLPVIELDSDLRQFADSDEGSEISVFLEAADEMFFWDDIEHW